MTQRAATHPPSSAALWLRAIRPFSFTASAVPVLLGACIGWAAGKDLAWPLLAPALVAAIAVHAGVNLFNDTHDYRRGVDRQGTLGGSGLLVSGQLRPRQTHFAALLLFGVALCLGCWFIALRGWPVAAIGAIGLAGGYSYTGQPVGYKYRALGDPLVLLLMGPLMVMGGELVLTGSFTATTVLIALPVGLLVMSILHGNNLRDLSDDRESGFRTIAMLLGSHRARLWYALMVLLAFAIVVALIATGALPLWSALVLLALPSALKNIGRVRRAEADPSEALADIDVSSAQTHALFGALLCASLVLGGLV